MPRRSLILCRDIVANPQKLIYIEMSEREEVAVNMEQMTVKIDPDCQRGFREAFASVDADKNGQLDKKEFRRFMVQAGQEKLSKYIFEVIDKDHSGGVSIDEFLEFGQAMWDIVTKKDMTRYLKMIFDACDVGPKGPDGKEVKKGYLTYKEFLKFMKYTGAKIGIFERKKAFKNYDEDGNGKIEFSEVMSKINFVLKSMTK